MRTTKIKIKNMYGINECELSGKNYEISGTNGTGKSSVLDAFRMALSNKSNRDYIIRRGASEGEVLIEMDSNVNISRKFRTDKADYKSVKEDGREIKSPEAFLRKLFTPLQLDPIQFLTYDAKEQNRVILDLIDFKWDLLWVKEQFGEVVPDVDYEQNILRVLHQIQAEDGYYFITRQDINRRIRNTQAFVEEIGETLPNGYNADKWRNIDLGSIYEEIETRRHKNREVEKARAFISARDNTVRGINADREIKLNALNNQYASRRNEIEKSIERLKNEIKELETEQKNMEEKKQDKIKVINAEFDAKIIECDANKKEYESVALNEIQDVEALLSEAKESERMKEFVREYDRMVSLQEEIKQNKRESDEFTEKIELARTLPAEILSKCDIPIAGLTIENGEPRINGLPVNNLSDGEKLMLCVDITRNGGGLLDIILIDGVEKLSTQHRNMLYDKCRDSGVQFITSLTNDSPLLTITEI